MTWTRQAVMVLAIVAVSMAGGAARATAQDPQEQGRRGPGGRQAALPVAEVERLFDGYVAMQAQDALKLTDAQFPQFLAKLKALQQERRQHLGARRALVAELNTALKATPPNEAQLGDAMRKIRDLDAKHIEEMRKAYEGIDQVLDPTQQARFRVFEESVERRKFDLMLRARRSAQKGDEASGR